MSRRKLVTTILAVLGTLLLLGCGGAFLFVVMVFSSNNRGSPELAAEWKAELEACRDPEEASQRLPRAFTKRFADGEWVIGLAQDSHGAWRRGGGIVVVKDSRGDVRAFFGHVCGEHAFARGYDASSLDKFYNRLLEGDIFAEHKFP